MLQLLLWLLLGYLLFNFLFRFLIPLVKAGYHFNRQLKAFRNRMKQHNNPQSAASAANPETHQTSRAEEDYIEFEEVKS